MCPFHDVPLIKTEETMTDTLAAIRATNLGCSITCKDLKASLQFYRDVLGFTVGETYENDGEVATAVVSSGDCRIVLNLDDGKLGWDRIKGQGFYLQINVISPADVDSTAARITASGGTLLSEPADREWGVRMFQFKDPDGFKLGVSTPLVG
jgi:predicted enzyme related to lactoylglutathione lyase